MSSLVPGFITKTRRLYRIATNACLDMQRRHRRRVLPPDVVPANVAEEQLAGVPQPLWLQPYPDRLLDELAATENEPEAAVIAKDTIELTLIAAIQLLRGRSCCDLTARGGRGVDSPRLGRGQSRRLANGRDSRKSAASRCCLPPSLGRRGFPRIRGASRGIVHVIRKVFNAGRAVSGLDDPNLGVPVS